MIRNKDMFCSLKSLDHIQTGLRIKIMPYILMEPAPYIKVKSGRAKRIKCTGA
jgi:hypothetical protein